MVDPVPTGVDDVGTGVLDTGIEEGSGIDGTDPAFGQKFDPEEPP